MIDWFLFSVSILSVLAPWGSVLFFGLLHIFFSNILRGITGCSCLRFRFLGWPSTGQGKPPEKGLGGSLFAFTNNGQSLCWPTPSNLIFRPQDSLLWPRERSPNSWSLRLLLSFFEALTEYFSDGFKVGPFYLLKKLGPSWISIGTLINGYRVWEFWVGSRDFRVLVPRIALCSILVNASALLPNSWFGKRRGWSVLGLVFHCSDHRRTIRRGLLLREVFCSSYLYSGWRLIQMLNFGRTRTQTRSNRSSLGGEFWINP